MPFCNDLFGNGFIQQITNGRHNIDVLVRYVRQLCGQNSDLFMDGLMLVHHKQILTLDLAEPAFNLNTGSFQVLFGNRYLQAVGQIYKFLIQLIGLHFLRTLQALKIAADVLLLAFSK